MNWTHEIVTRLLALRQKFLPTLVIIDSTEHLQDPLTLQHTETMNEVISKLKEDGIDPKTLNDLMSSSSSAEASCHAVKSVSRFDAYGKDIISLFSHKNLSQTISMDLLASIFVFRKQ